jgi:hypothetical protein
MSEDSEAQLRTIVSLLLDATRERRVSWSQDIVVSSAFSTPLGDSAVLIDEVVEEHGPGTPGDFPPSFRMGLHNKEGVPVEQYSVRPGESMWEGMDALYSLARRQALRSDEVIASVIDELKKRTNKP